MNNYNSLIEALNGLKKQGYTEDFNLQETCIHCGADIRLHPDEFVIDEFYRFEGDSNPDDSSIVYAISSLNGELKGTLVDAYGMYASSLSPAMVAKLGFK